MDVKTCCCCCSIGTVGIRSSVEKTAYTSLETVRAVCEIDNTQCTKAFDGVTVSLVQRILLNDNGAGPRTF